MGRRTNDATIKVFDEELVFEEPPSKEREVPVLKKLREYPERWAKVAWYPGTSTAYNRAKTLREKPLVPGLWEFHGTKSDDGEGGSTLYAKYLGPDPSAPPDPSAEPGKVNGRQGSTDHDAARRAAAANAG